MQDTIVTVFGGSGFIGKYVISNLLKNGFRVRVASRNINSAKAIKTMGETGRISINSCDIKILDQVESVMIGSSAVINLTGIIKPHINNSFYDVHVEGAKNISYSCKKLNIDRVVNISAIGANKDSQAIYNKTKNEGEKIFYENFPETVILRPSLVYGKEDSFFNYFARVASFSPIKPLIGNGETKFQPIWVEDLSKIIVKSLYISKNKPRVYEIGGKEVFSFKELILWMLQEIKIKRQIVSIPFTAAKYLASFVELFPFAPITKDQVILLTKNNIVKKGAAGIENFKVMPTPLKIAAKPQLMRYKKRGGH